MRKFFICLTYFLLTVSCLYAADQELLKATDVSRIMQQILSQHVDKKEVTVKLLQSALDTYINQFDPDRVYLLDSEVKPFTHESSVELQKAIDEYKIQNFAIFKQLAQVIQRSILRAQEIRHNLESESKDPFFQSEAAHIASLGPDNKKLFAQNENQLKEQWLQNLGTFVNSQKRQFGEAMTARNREQVLKIYENRLRAFEDQYLYLSDTGTPLPMAQQENLFAIHILKALASSLDAHTSFYQPDEAYRLRVHLMKEFQGIGIVFKETVNGVIVNHLVDGGPAAKNGTIKSGDVLIAIDGKPIADEPFETVIETLHADKNDQTKLTLQHTETNGQLSAPYQVDLKREKITLNDDRVDVSSEPFGNGIIGKITLHAFYQGDGVSSEKDVRDAIAKLERQGNLRGLILDLRDNSGGFLSQAVKVAGLFITNGIIVISKYSNGDEKFYRDVDGKTSFEGPLVVLTSKITASAAEIVAQALQDYGVALIVGDEHTYGKGTIQTQTVTDNNSSSYFKVTVGKYYTVSGHTPQKEGVKADIVVPSRWHNQEIGEAYVESVGADQIDPAYDDTLKDISADVRPWYLKYYMPTLQHPQNTWKNLLPTLRQNSTYRMAQNKNYQYFLKGKVTGDEDDDDAMEEDEWVATSKKAKTIGADDLQMQEAVNIVKDMVLLHSLESQQNKKSEKPAEKGSQELIQSAH
jgi:carboxyl-terminal processing protease